VNDIHLVTDMGQIIKVQRPLLAACIIGLQVILEGAFTIALLGVLLYKSKQSNFLIHDLSPGL
jgi:hypothetical protein